MSMQAASLEVLEKANVPAPQARAIVQAIEIEIAGAQNVLATKQDIHALAQATKQDIHALAQATKQDIQALEQSTRQSIQALAQSTRQSIHALAQSTRQSIHALAQSTRQNIHALEVKIEVVRSDVLRQMYTAILGQTALLLGIAYFFVTHLQH